MITFLINTLSILCYIKSPLVLPFKTYNPLITKDNNLLQLIKKASDEELVKTLLQNLIYIKMDFGSNISQKIDFFIYMHKSEFFFNILDIDNNNNRKIINYPDLEYNKFPLLKNILNLTYYNFSLCETPFKPGYTLEKLYLANETIKLILKNDLNEKKKEQKKEIRVYIPYKEYIKYDHRPGVIGLSFSNYFIVNIKDKISIKLDNWIIKYNDNLKDEGELIIGGFPHEYDSQHYSKERLRTSKVYLGENIHPDWNLQFIKSFIIYNKDKSLNEYELKQNTYSLLSIEEFFILGTDEYFHKIQNIFFNDYISKSICQKQTHKKTKYVMNYYHIMCYFNGDQKKLKTFLNNFPILKFYQSEMDYNFTLTGSDLFTIIPDNNRILFNIEFLENNNNWVFGKPFFKKYQLIFNDEAKIISYYFDKKDEKVKENYLNGTKKDIYIIISLLIIINFVIFYYFKKNKVKYKYENRNFELSEYFNSS